MSVRTHSSQCAGGFSKMLKSLATGIFLACGFLVVGISGQKNVGPGKWSVLNIMKCDNDDAMPIKLEPNRRKVNRTHDGFNCNMTLEEPIDDGYACRIEICKVVDGGCKDYNTLADDSVINFCNKYAEENVKTAFMAAEIDPPEFPIPVGKHSLRNFLFDYDELPPEGPYGEYVATAYLVKNARNMLCIKVHVKFEEVEDE